MLSLVKKPNIFEYTCSRKYSLDGKYQIPNGLSYRPLLLMDFQKKTYMAQNQKEFQKIKIQTTRTTLQDNLYRKELQKVVGQLNSNITKIEKKINFDNVIFQKLTTSYALSEAQIQDYDQIALTQEITKAVNNLPAKYDQQTYFDFIKKFGTHYREQIKIGGLIEQIGYTQRSYSQENSLDYIGDQFLYNFVQEELKKHFAVDHIPTHLLDKHPAQDYLDASEIRSFFIKGGNTNSLQGWVESLEANPVVIEQKLVNITHIMTETYFPNNKNLKKIKDNTNKALKAYLIDSQGCTNANAINYNKNALVNDNSCFFTVFDGSYQTANSNQCIQAMTDKYQLNNPKTQDISCDNQSKTVKIAEYDYSGCNIEQYFCLRQDPLSLQNHDLYQSLEICENKTISNVFFKNSQQYYCPNKDQNTQTQLQFEIKNSPARQINTCLQNFCYQKDNQFGVQNFVNRHKGNCQGYDIPKNKENIFQSCTDGCLVLYGKLKLAADCDLEQFICINQEREIQCYNN